MHISQRPVPSHSKVVFGKAPFLLDLRPGDHDCNVVTMYLLNALAVWATVEAKVEGLYAHLVADEPARLAEFRELMGWDRRAKALIAIVAEKRPDKQDIVAALLSRVREPAAIRNEIAHNIWARDEASLAHLFVFQADVYGRISVHAARDDADEGTLAFAHELFATGRVVGRAEAVAAYEAIEAASDAMHTAWVAFFEPEHDMRGRDMVDLFDRLENDPEIAERAANRARSRERKERQKRRAAAASPSQSDPEGEAQS